MQRISLLKKVSFIVVVLVVGVFSLSLAGTFPDNMKGLVPTTFENCTPGTWVGGVRWINDHQDYEDAPQIDLKSVGSQVVMLPPGDYAITHYQPRYKVVVDGGYIFSPAKILDFREIAVDTVKTHSFGCGE
jgi:hypothetical protein